MLRFEYSLELVVSFIRLKCDRRYDMECENLMAVESVSRPGIKYMFTTKVGLCARCSEVCAITLN